MNDALSFRIGPPRLPLNSRFLYGGNAAAYRALLEFKCSLLNCVENWPCKKSLPGFVRISIRPKPGLSYSAEKGFELMRISRIDDFGGTVPVKPSVMIWPP